LRRNLFATGYPPRRFRMNPLKTGRAVSFTALVTDLQGRGAMSCSTSLDNLFKASSN
jgi:hypothetical protein